MRWRMCRRSRIWWCGRRVCCRQETGCTQGVEITLEKRIPMGGGLGGGSSDAATTLLALNRLWNLKLSRERLMQLGLTLGADVPVFVFGENAFAEGVGERWQRVGAARGVVCGAVPAGGCAHGQDFYIRIDTEIRIPSQFAPFRLGRARGAPGWAVTICRLCAAKCSGSGGAPTWLGRLRWRNDDRFRCLRIRRVCQRGRSARGSPE